MDGVWLAVKYVSDPFPVEYVAFVSQQEAQDFIDRNTMWSAVRFTPFGVPFSD